MGLKPGDQAPNFDLTDQNGKTIPLKQFRGKKVLIFFYPKAGTSG
jgi:thioredoxin-dependent peroxiredoxin